METSFFVLLGTFWNNWRAILFWEVCPFQESQLLWPCFSGLHTVGSRCEAVGVIYLPTSSCAGRSRPRAMQGRAEACGGSMEASVWKEIKMPLLKAPSLPPSLCAWGKPRGSRSVTGPALRLMDIYCGAERPLWVLREQPRCPHSEWGSVTCTWPLAPWFDGTGGVFLLPWNPLLFSFYCCCVLVLRKRRFSIHCSVAGTLFKYIQTEICVAFQHALPAPLLMAQL